MEEKKVTLSDNEIDELITAANEVNKDNESIKKIQEVKEKSIDELLDLAEEDENKNVVLSINPATGLPEGVSAANGFGFDKDTDLFDEFLDTSKEAISTEDFSVPEVGKATKEEINSDLSIADMEEIKNLLIKKDKDKSNQIKYNDLPEILKKEIDSRVRREFGRSVGPSQYGMVRNMLANDIMDSIYANILQNKLTEVSADLSTSVKNLIKEEYSDINASQFKQQEHIYTKKLVELANDKYKDDPEKSKLLLDVSEGYTQAHTLEKMYSAYSRGGKLMKIRKIDIEKLHKLVRDFECKYENSTFTLRGNIMDTIQVLSRHVNKRFSEDIIKGFIALFCKYTYSMKPSNVGEHTFMYYFVSNILELDLPNTDKDALKHRDEFIETVNHFLTLIDEKINN